MENTPKCPCCSNHCEQNNLQCGKGESYFNGEAEGSRSHGPEHGHHHGHHKHPEFPSGSLPDLLMQCGGKLFHGEGEDMFHVLTGEEQDTLSALLGKLLTETSSR